MDCLGNDHYPVKLFFNLKPKMRINPLNQGGKKRKTKKRKQIFIKSHKNKTSIF